MSVLVINVQLMRFKTTSLWGLKQNISDKYSVYDCRSWHHIDGTVIGLWVDNLQFDSW